MIYYYCVKRDLLSVSDLSREEIMSLMDETLLTKRQGERCLLPGKVLALLFEKPSLRTRVSFEVAMHQLDGHTVYLSPEEVGLGKRESVSDVARVLSRYVDCIAARTFSHDTLHALAQYSSVPVVNALSDLEHPCQALSDLLTIYEKKGKLAGLTLAFIGDGNNVANSLLLAASLTGMNFSFASPSSYEIGEEVSKQGRQYAGRSGSKIRLSNDPFQAVREADVVYTDVWTSMGQEAEREERILAFSGYQVNDRLLSLAKEDALFMHPLPAHHGEEVAADLLDSRQSVVFDQAENRLHLQKVLLARIVLSAFSVDK